MTTYWEATYTERAHNVSDEDEIKRIREYIAALKAELARVRAQDPVEFWWDEVARYQRLINAILAIKASKRTDAQIEALERYQREQAEAIFRFRLAREPKRTWYDITGDIVWGQTTFTQVAKTGPGSFQITLKGNHPEFKGGEEIRFEIDDLRTFGGWVTSVDRGYFFPDMSSPKTVLNGTDYNILFDRLAVRNYPWEYANMASQGMDIGFYRGWENFPQGTMDDEMIDTIFGTYVLPDLPLDFNWTVNSDDATVEAISTPAPVSPWTMPEAGSTLRRSMQSISQITSGIWHIDATMTLQYHDRETITAPFPITDGMGPRIPGTTGDPTTGGISCQNLKVTYDISSMANDVLVWGTLANTVAGEIMVWHEYGDIAFWERYYLRLINEAQRELNKLLAISVSRRTAKQKARIVTLRKRIATYKARLEDARNRAWDPLSGDPRPVNAIVNSIDTWGRWQMGEFRQDIHHTEWLQKRGHAILERYDEPVITASCTIYDPGYQAGQVVRLRSYEHGIDANLVIRQMQISFAVAKEPHDGKYYAVPKYDLDLGINPEAPWNIYDYLPYPGESTPGLGGDQTGG